MPCQGTVAGLPQASGYADIDLVLVHGHRQTDVQMMDENGIRVDVHL